MRVKVHIEGDERYPDYSLDAVRDEKKGYVEIEEEFLQEYQRIEAEYNRMQRRLKELVTTQLMKAIEQR